MSDKNNKLQQREYVGAAFYTAPNDIVAQMRALEAELDDIYDKIRACTNEVEKAELRIQQKKLEDSMDLMSQMLCFAKKV